MNCRPWGDHHGRPAGRRSRYARVIYEDAHGRSRALRYRESDEYLFPVTMISRRQEVGKPDPVRPRYLPKAYSIITPCLPPAQPFQ